ncbi:hypothetical protein R3P38DRAFT_3335296 [Favolaschia claudopus]|uniref:DUF6589 domain-containing protein n=1 Tax=Favolaschia claudopus TaxID=2862362 RepID=A0AAV9Z9L4_9AGAR
MATTPEPSTGSPCYLGWWYDPAEIPHNRKIQSIILILKQMKMSPIDLVTEILAQDEEFAANVDGFYRSAGLEQLLNLVMANKRRGAPRLYAWFEDFSMDRLLQDIHREMDDLSTVFLRHTTELTPESISDFDFERDITETCRERTPKLRAILTAAAQTKRAEKENKLKDVEPFISMIQSQIAKTRSENNNLCAIPCSLYFLSSAMPRKVIDTLHHAGMCCSYNTTKDLHCTLSKGHLRLAELIARTGHSLGWDNNHLSLSPHVEQRTLAPPKVQTGTTSIIYLLRGLLDLVTLSLQRIRERRARLEMITFADIRPTHSQCVSLRHHYDLSLVDILVNYESKFDYLGDSSELQHPSYRPPPPNYRTSEYVLRTTTIDEGTTEGTIQINENIYLEQLKFGIHDLDDIAVPTYNDQKTNALIRSAQHLRTNDVSAILRLEHLQPAPGAFHIELNLAWMILRTHRGKSNDIGSLQYFIGLLAKKRLGADKPDFETLVSLLEQVLIGLVLHYWEVESGMSVQDLAKSKPSPARLREMAGKIYEKYVAGISDDDDDEEDDDDSPDHMQRNLRLLTRDILVFYTLQRAISSGDFGRVELLLGTLTMMFSGGGCLQYKTELLYFQQNLQKAWPESFANIVRDNALITTSGRSYYGVDKNAEFNINFQKNYFAAHGVHASWDFLADLSPNIPLLRRLKTQFGEFLGAPWQGIRHSKVDCFDQIKKVKVKMQEYAVHLPSAVGRRPTEEKTVDVVDEGASILRDTGIKSWSKAYKTWWSGE